MKAAAAQESPEQVEQRIQQEVQAALAKAGHDLKARELEMKERLTDAQIKKVMADAVQVGVQAAFSAMQGGAQVAMNPAIAPIADAIMTGAGYQKPNPGGDDPDFPVPGVAAGGPAPRPGGPGAADDTDQVRENTSPAFPPIPQEPARGIRGSRRPPMATTCRLAPDRQQFYSSRLRAAFLPLCLGLVFLARFLTLLQAMAHAAVAKAAALRCCGFKSRWRGAQVPHRIAGPLRPRRYVAGQA